MKPKDKLERKKKDMWRIEEKAIIDLKLEIENKEKERKRIE